MLPSSSPESVGMSSERLQRAFGILQGWLNDGDVFHLGAEHELIAGNAGPLAPGTLTIQGEPPLYLRPPRPLTVTRGGGYLFYPGIRALRAIAAGEPQ